MTTMRNVLSRVTPFNHLGLATVMSPSCEKSLFSSLLMAPVSLTPIGVVSGCLFTYCLLQECICCWSRVGITRVTTSRGTLPLYGLLLISYRAACLLTFYCRNAFVAGHA